MAPDKSALWIRDSLARDIGRRAVDGLKHG